jgi:hypothetical protein
MKGFEKEECGVRKFDDLSIKKYRLALSKSQILPKPCHNTYGPA